MRTAFTVLAMIISLAVAVCLFLTLGAATPEALPLASKPPQAHDPAPRVLSRADCAVLEVWLRREGTHVRVESGKLVVVDRVVMVVLECRSESGQMAFTLIKALGHLDRQEVYEKNHECD